MRLEAAGIGVWSRIDAVCRTLLGFGGVAAVLLEAGPEFAALTATLAGRCLIMVVFAGCLMRIILVAIAFDKRRAIMQWAADHLALSARLHQPLSIAMLDLDHFKRVNDRFGHVAGDHALRLFAREAASGMPGGHWLGRYDGEEFLAALPATTARQAELILRQVRDRVALADRAAIGPNLLVTMTAGIAECRAGDTIEDVIRRADVALYAGKAHGRDRVVIAQPEPRETGGHGLRRRAF